MDASTLVVTNGSCAGTRMVVKLWHATRLLMLRLRLDVSRLVMNSLLGFRSDVERDAGDICHGIGELRVEKT